MRHSAVRPVVCLAHLAMSPRSSRAIGAVLWAFAFAAACAPFDEEHGSEERATSDTLRRGFADVDVFVGTPFIVIPDDAPRTFAQGPIEIPCRVHNLSSASIEGRIEVVLDGIARPGSTHILSSIPSGAGADCTTSFSWVYQGSHHLELILQQRTGESFVVWTPAGLEWVERFDPISTATFDFDVAAPPLPPPPPVLYNQVLQKSSHNSYAQAESIIDQLMYFGVRHFDLDLHFYHHGKSLPDRDWFVYHFDQGVIDNVAESNFHSGDFSRCLTLSRCIALFGAFHRAVPNHEVITLVIEASSDDFDHPTSTGTHRASDLDDLLTAQVGASFFTPDMLRRRCRPSGEISLRESVGSIAPYSGCTWPSLEELRGKFILLIMNDESYFDGHDGLGFRLYTEPGEISDQLLFYGSPASTANDYFAQNLIARAQHWSTETGKYGADSAATWASFVVSNAQIMSTNRINEHEHPFATTRNAFGYPFRCAPGAASCNLQDARESTNSFELSVRSGAIGGSFDSFVFLAQERPAGAQSGIWSAMISTASSDVSTSASGCLMARESLDPSSPHFAICKAADTNGLFVQLRSAGCNGPCGTARQGANMHDFVGGEILEEDAAFVRLRIVEQPWGAEVFAEGSFDRIHWNPIVVEGRTDWPFPNGLRFQGLAASSDNTSNRNDDASPYRFVFADVSRSASLEDVMSEGARLSGPTAFPLWVNVGSVEERGLVIDGTTLP
jgi:hypothetical protein